MIGFLAFIPLLIIFPSAYSHPNNLLLMYLSGQEQGLIDCSHLSEHYISDLPIPDGFEFYNMIVGKDTERLWNISHCGIIGIFENV